MPAWNSRNFVFLLLFLFFIVAPILVLGTVFVSCKFEGSRCWLWMDCPNAYVMLAGFAMGLIPGAIVFAYAHFKGTTRYFRDTKAEAAEKAALEAAEKAAGVEKARFEVDLARDLVRKSHDAYEAAVAAAKEEKPVDDAKWWMMFVKSPTQRIAHALEELNQAKTMFVKAEATLAAAESAAAIAVSKAAIAKTNATGTGISGTGSGSLEPADLARIEQAAKAAREHARVANAEAENAKRAAEAAEAAARAAKTAADAAPNNAALASEAQAKADAARHAAAEAERLRTDAAMAENDAAAKAAVWGSTLFGPKGMQQALLEQTTLERASKIREDEFEGFSYLAVLLVACCWASFMICWSGVLDLANPRGPAAAEGKSAIIEPGIFEVPKPDELTDENPKNDPAKKGKSKKDAKPPVAEPPQPAPSVGPIPTSRDAVIGDPTLAYIQRAKIALQLSSIGAYVYVLILLGRRNFQRDITPGSILWCCATLALGPLLALVLAHVWSQNLKAGEPDQLPDLLGLFSGNSIYFFAGLAPRNIIGMLFEIMRRITIAVTGKNPPESRVLPLQQIRGVTLDVEERLLEEGITDVVNLAMADPLRLLRNTSFDKFQILTWIDEALLMYTFPQHWQALENEGITGAMDMAWYVVTLQDTQALADRIRYDPDSLKKTVRRLAEDAQVQLLWILYDLDNPNT